MYAEVIYETGAKSVISYDSLEELQSAIKDQNDRALQGRPGAAQDQEERSDVDYNQPGMVHPNTARQRPAEHVKRVILYGDDHPADFVDSTTIDAETLKGNIDSMAVEGGQVDPNQLISFIRGEMSPLYPVDQGAHRSMYKAPGTELDLTFLEGTPDESAGDV